MCPYVEKGAPAAAMKLRTSRGAVTLRSPGGRYGIAVLSQGWGDGPEEKVV